MFSLLLQVYKTRSLLLLDTDLLNDIEADLSDLITNCILEIIMITFLVTLSLWMPTSHDGYYQGVGDWNLRRFGVVRTKLFLVQASWARAQWHNRQSTESLCLNFSSRVLTNHFNVLNKLQSIASTADMFTTSQCLSHIFSYSETAHSLRWARWCFAVEITWRLSWWPR